MKSKEGIIILKSKIKIGVRWREYFEDFFIYNVYIYDRSVFDMIMNRVKMIFFFYIIIWRGWNVIKVMKDNKVVVFDRILEIYKLGGGLIIYLVLLIFG